MTNEEFRKKLRDQIDEYLKSKEQPQQPTQG
jgi:hypothetical protein